MTTRDPFKPSYFDTILFNPFLDLPREWRQKQITDQKIWTRRFLLPTVRILSLILIRVTLIVKRILPFEVTSIPTLNFLSHLYIRKFLSPVGQEIVFRHFSIENNLIDFVVDNSGDPDIETWDLRPKSWREMGDHKGHNMTLLHDANILNFFVDLGQSSASDVHLLRHRDKIDFKSIGPIDDFMIEKEDQIIAIDFETSLYIMIFFLVLLVDQKTAETSANSLNLDDSLMISLSNITGDERFRHWSPNRFVNRVYWPGDVVQSLYFHIMLCEYAYSRLMKLKEES